MLSFTLLILVSHQTFYGGLAFEAHSLPELPGIKPMPHTGIEAALEPELGRTLVDDQVEEGKKMMTGTGQDVMPALPELPELEALPNMDFKMNEENLHPKEDLSIVDKEESPSMEKAPSEEFRIPADDAPLDSIEREQRSMEAQAANEIQEATLRASMRRAQNLQAKVHGMKKGLRAEALRRRVELDQKRFVKARAAAETFQRRTNMVATSRIEKADQRAAEMVREAVAKSKAYRKKVRDEANVAISRAKKEATELYEDARSELSSDKRKAQASIKAHAAYEKAEAVAYEAEKEAQRVREEASNGVGKKGGHVFYLSL